MVRPSNRLWMWPMICLGVALASGCGSDGSTGEFAVTRDTLPGGVVRVRGPEGGTWTEETEWDLTELFRVGAVEGEGPEVFGQVWAVEMDLTGQLYVLDRLAKEVRIFDQTGGFVRALGREGEGPGEFQNPFGMAWDSAGNLWIVDVRLRRYSTFSLDGQHLREYRRTVGGYSWPWPGRFARNGRLYEASLSRDGNQLVEFEPQAELMPLDSFPLKLPDATGYWDLRDERRIGSIVQIPFAGQPEWVLDGTAKLWVGESASYSLAHQDLSGDTLMVIERNVAPVPVSPEERARAVEDLGEDANHPKMDLSRLPSTKPFFRRLIPVDTGDLWVLREGEGALWFFDVFAPDGSYRGPIKLPVEPELFPPPVIRGEHVVVVTHDELDVQSIVVYRVRRPTR